MIIDDAEALRSWLTIHLQPLCDADPAALAKYVLALIKKDKPEEELMVTMENQMDVFLQTETKGFIQTLFNVVASKEYLNPPAEESAPEKQEEQEEEPPQEETKVKEDSERRLSGDKEERNREPLEATDPNTVKEGRGGDENKKDVDDRRNKQRQHSPARRRQNRTPPRRYRERSYSPQQRYPRDRDVRPPRRRSRSPIRRAPRAHSSRSPPRHRPRSTDRYRSPPRRANSRDSTPTKDEGGYNPSAKRIRCRDYDEKGFCLKGDLCKFDHGTDAVVLEDSTKVPVGYQPLPVEPYVPGIPSAGIPYPPPSMPVPPPSFPPPGSKRPADGGNYGPPNKKFDFNRLGGRGGRGRGGRGGGRGGRGGASNMLAVRNIPIEMNSITHLNAHFARFGALQNIQINFEGDPSSALVTFSTPDEANAAFSTAEAVMNNRFIKVYWHMDKNNVKDKLNNSGNSQLVMVHGERLTKTLVNDEVNGADKSKQEKEKKIQEIIKNQEMMQNRVDMVKKTEEKRKEASKQQESLIKSKQTLLTGMIEEQKVLIAKLDKSKGTLKAEEKKAIMGILKDLTSKIEKTKEEIKTALTISSVKNKSRQEVQKELLDAEMELFNCQQDNSDQTADIQQKVNLLRIEAAKNGLLPTSRPPRGRGARARGFRGSGGGYFSPRGAWRGRGGRGRGFTLSPGSSTLDRRPSRILVSGYELEEKDELVQHFQKFGDISDIVEDQATPSVILKFKTRRFAEAAMLSGKSYGDRILQLSWYNDGTPERDTEQYVEEEVAPDDDYTPPQHDYLPPGLQEHEDSLSQGSHGEEETGAAGEEAEQQEEEQEEAEEEEEEEELNDDLLDDDEDEEEEEERSWKRRNAEDD